MFLKPKYYYFSNNDTSLIEIPISTPPFSSNIKNPNPQKPQSHHNNKNIMSANLHLPLSMKFCFLVSLVYMSFLTLSVNGGHSRSLQPLQRQCLTNCHLCQDMFGSRFEGHLCGQTCIKLRGRVLEKLMPDCNDIVSISPFWNPTGTAIHHRRTTSNLAGNLNSIHNDNSREWFWLMDLKKKQFWKCSLDNSDSKIVDYLKKILCEKKLYIHPDFASRRLNCMDPVVVLLWNKAWNF